MRAHDGVVGGKTKRGCQHQAQHHCPGPPVPPPVAGRPSRRPGQIRRHDRLRRGVRRVIFPDQRPRISPHSPGDSTNVPPGVEITAARGIVVMLDATDDCLPDPGPLADLGHAETGPATRLRQVFADAHGAPPLPQSHRAPHRARGADNSPSIIPPSAPNRASRQRTGLDRVLPRVVSDRPGARSSGNNHHDRSRPRSPSAPGVEGAESPARIMSVRVRPRRTASRPGWQHNKMPCIGSWTR